MKVICDNCGAMYKIPDEKLVKPVNKATCRQCGHRMLIPRPRRGADPDERTLVTAVPPTPPPAPSRGDSGPPTTPIHEVEEKTAPPGGRRTEETRWVRNELPTPRDTPSSSGRPQVQIGGAATERVPAHASTPRPQADAQRRPTNAFDDGDDDVATQVGPDPTLTYTPREDDDEDEDEQAVAPPPPAADAHQQEAEPESEPPRRKKTSSRKKAPPAHDPRGDMGLALFGVMVALAGVAILAAVSVVDASWSYGVVLGGSVVGTMLAVGGGVGAFLVLLTSGRGRKPAWKVASVMLAIVAALLVGGLPAGVRVGVDFVNAGMEGMDQFGELLAGMQPAPGTEDPEVEPADPDGATLADDDGTALADVAEDTDAMAEDTDAMASDAAADANGGGPEEGSTEEDDTTERATTSTSGTSRSSTGGRSGRTTSRSSTSGRSGRTTSRTSTAPSGGSSEPEFTEEEELTLPDDLSDLGSDSSSSGGSAASDLPVSPPLTAIDVMVKSNTGVKRCFFDYQQAEGSLPKRVDVKFTIKPDGDATNIGTTQRKLEGTELESCLIRSIRSITFPPSQKGTTLTFPFVFG